MHGCSCGRSQSDGGTYFRDPWIVNIYEIFQETLAPLCLGALISHHHVLTSKYCFGRMEAGEYVLKWPIDEYKEKIHLMLGVKESYPYLGNGAFPHSSSLIRNYDRLKYHDILLNDVEEIKQNPNDAFCMVTMKHYVKFKGNMRALCLPENPNQFYGQGENKAVQIHGYGYGNQIRDELIDVAKTEVNQGKMLRSSRTIIHYGTNAISRRDCSGKINAMNLIMYNLLD